MLAVDRVLLEPARAEILLDFLHVLRDSAEISKRAAAVLPDLAHRLFESAPNRFLLRGHAPERFARALLDPAAALSLRAAVLLPTRHHSHGLLIESFLLAGEALETVHRFLHAGRRGGPLHRLLLAQEPGRRLVQRDRGLLAPAQATREILVRIPPDRVLLVRERA